ncbi:MAG TPA: SpoIIE family protein phosphatase, partial [Thermoanaerobaculia bacterium]|nr:SpoIIE family protein phosphatase [Thermoanaerobaculia bacterium]
NQRLLAETREGDFQLKYRLWELESLYDIGLSIASTLNVDELADEILFRMISLTNARRAALYLRNGDSFALFRAFGEARELDSDLAARLVFEGAPISFDGAPDCLFPDCATFVAVPIRGNNAVIGVLAAADRETREGGIAPFEANELRLLSLFANQVAIALENARLHREALEKQAMERELELAATIQRDILPRFVPQHDDLELATLSRPARQVGGDYHAFFEQDGVVTMLLADVAGKSMPAALLVSALHAVVQLLFAEGRELGEIATELNRHIHSWSAENKFITMVMASIDREHETLRFVNAGHNPCYVIYGDKLETLKSHGLPIGILGQTRYMTQTRAFPAGSAVVLYSDGITEAENEAGEEFENPRLETIMTTTLGASANDLRDRIAAAVDEFVGSAPQKDDQTLVIARSR